MEKLAAAACLGTNTGAPGAVLPILNGFERVRGGIDQLRADSTNSGLVLDDLRPIRPSLARCNSSA